MEGGRKIGWWKAWRKVERSCGSGGREGERERNAGSRGDSGIRFGCGTVATPARLGIQLTAARDTRSVRRFLHGVCNGRYDERPAVRGGLDPDRRRNRWPTPSLSLFRAPLRVPPDVRTVCEKKRDESFVDRCAWREGIGD